MSENGARFLCGAYAAAPPDLDTDRARERRWYELLRSEELVGGLELPFRHELHRHGAEHLAGLLDPSWSCVVTDIPWTDAVSRSDAGYGLASRDTRGRRRAVDDVRTLFEEVAELRRLAGESIVSAVELHSAPRTNGDNSSPEVLADSLSEIGAWEWGEVRLCVEHVDAAVAERKAQKGFLRLDEEIRAVEESSQTCGRTILQAINWGRSAIETRSRRGPVDHVRKLHTAGTLGGLVFSGVSATAEHGIDPWADSHPAMIAEDPGSLLSSREIEETLHAAGDTELIFLGVKMRAPGSLGEASDLAERLAPSVAALRAIAASARHTSARS